ncbi:MAG TPA: hypothetical protein VHQ88_06405, partial [Burkholderiales bacterium]|nr:hypothetical protein [Burkholderiales bacterium]
MTVTGTLHALRESNSVVGLRVNAKIDHGYALRSVMLHGGYDILRSRGRFAFEPGIDLGVGRALRPLFEGTGAYGGASATFRLRVSPWGDEPAYNLAWPIFEIVLLPRGGLWMPPESGPDSR